MSFTDLDLSPALLRGIARLGFEEPTPIQRAALPPALAGRDILAAAMTGSGKTAAFMLPILDRLASRPRGAIRALVLTPTRELAAQVHQHLIDLGHHTAVTSAAVFGGVKPGAQERALRSGVDVVVATPGRLLDHMSHSWCRFDALEILVLDEADRMLDMGFLPDVRRILSRLPKRQQTMLFSATLPRPIVELSRQMLHDPVRIDVERRAAPAVGIDHQALPVPQRLKPMLLLEMLRREEITTALVFTRTKHRANRLARYLESAGVGCDRIHGNRSQPQRERALADFKKGRIRILVATDIAARGIDIEALPHVVNFDVPAQAEDYIHRVGRTARARYTGNAMTLVSPEEEGDLTIIERAVGQRLARRQLDGFDYAAEAPARFEIPVGERLAAVRAQRLSGQAAREGSARRTAGASARHGRPPATSVKTAPSAGTAQATPDRHPRPNRARRRRARRRTA